MTFEQTVNLVQQWAFARGLSDADPAKQLLKLTEELGETVSAFIKGNGDGVIDGLGDMLVVMTVFCLQYGLDLAECFELAYEEIKERQGAVINGTFVKNQDIYDGSTIVVDDWEDK
jgi:NTP pyrophosphatase (non-canonical NTP hydrolase)